jgi:putative nucleotidyltransferase with HDIG domain
MLNASVVEEQIPQFVRSVVDRLRTSGHQAYIVGGAIRDLCMHRAAADWDVATSAIPEEIQSIFREIKKFSLKQGTVTLVHSARHYEVTTFRSSRDFGQSIEEDLNHRDFTMDAMAYNQAMKAILDPHGGREDILGRLVRAVGDPKSRFIEDPVRLLRAVRLATELNFAIERKTLETINSMAREVGRVAKERIREELLKMLMSQRPSVGFNLMLRTGLLKELIPELLEGYRKKQDASHRYTIFKHIMETVDCVDPDPVLRLTALFHDIAKPRVREKIDGQFRFLGHEEISATLAKEIMKRLKFNNKMIGKVTNLVTHHMSVAVYHSGWSDGALRRLIRRVGPDNIDHLLGFRRADILAHGLEDKNVGQFRDLKKRVAELRKGPLALEPQDLAVGGHRVMQITGLSQGPEVGEVLKRLLEKVTEHPELNNEEMLTALVKNMKDLGLKRNKN